MSGTTVKCSTNSFGSFVDYTFRSLCIITGSHNVERLTLIQYNYAMILLIFTVGKASHHCTIHQP